MVFLEPKLKGDEKGITDYYSWLIQKDTGIELTRPLRRGHISFINDRESEMNGKWEEVKKKWNKKRIDIVLDVRPFYTRSKKKNGETEGGHWWLIVPHEERGELQSIRNELGLGRPHFGMHMTIGKAVNKRPTERNDAGNTTAIKMNIEQSDYIIDLIEKGYKKID